MDTNPFKREAVLYSEERPFTEQIFLNPDKKNPEQRKASALFLGRKLQVPVNALDKERERRPEDWKSMQEEEVQFQSGEGGT